MLRNSDVSLADLKAEFERTGVPTGHFNIVGLSVGLPDTDGDDIADLYDNDIDGDGWNNDDDFYPLNADISDSLEIGDEVPLMDLSYKRAYIDEVSDDVSRVKVRTKLENILEYATNRSGNLNSEVTIELEKVSDGKYVYENEYITVSLIYVGDFSSIDSIYNYRLL